MRQRLFRHLLLLICAPFAFCTGHGGDAAGFLAETLPLARFAGEGDLYEEPVLGRFRATPHRFPLIESETVGRAYVFRSAAGAYLLYVPAKGGTSCGVPLGWVKTKAGLSPLFYSLRHRAWVHLAPQSPDVNGLWLFDYSSRDWFSYR